MAKSIRGDAAPTSESRNLQELLGGLGLELTPLFPEIEPELEHMLVQFTGELADDSASEAVVEVRRMPGVADAYLKARGELPAGGDG